MTVLENTDIGSIHLETRMLISVVVHNVAAVSPRF